MSTKDVLFHEKSMRLLVILAIVSGLGAFCYGWYQQISLSFIWRDAYRNAHIFGDDCDYATGVWTNTSFADVLAAKHVVTKTIAPFRRLQTPPIVHENGYLILRCRFDGSLEADKAFAWMGLGPIFGDSAIYVNQRLKAKQADNGNVEFPLSDEDRHKNSEITIISRHDPKFDFIGPASLLSFYFTTDRTTKLGIDHVWWYYKVQRPIFHLAYAMSLFLFLATAWIMGMRYADIGWLVLIAGILIIKESILYSPHGAMPGLQENLYAVLRYIEILALGSGLLAFLRLPLQFLTPSRLFCSGAVAITTLRLSLPPSYWKILGFTQTNAPVLATIIFLGIGIIGIILSRHLTRKRRLHVLLVALVALSAAPLYAVQLLAGAQTAFAVEPYLSYWLLSICTIFLASDLVGFYRDYFQEKGLRQRSDEEKAQLITKINLGQAVQNLLLPKYMNGNLGTLQYTFFHQPSPTVASLPGNWITTWQDGNTTHLLLGEVVGMGPQAALAVTAILAAVHEEKVSGTGLENCLERIGRLLSGLFDGHVVTNLAAATLKPGAKVQLFCCGAVNWHLIDQGELKHIDVNGTHLGAKSAVEFQSLELKLNAGQLLFAGTAGVIDGTRSVANLLKKVKECHENRESGGHQQLYQMAVASGRQHIPEGERSMVVISNGAGLCAEGTEDQDK